MTNAALDAASALFSLDESALRCPYPAYDIMRATSPVFWSEQLGAFVITREADAQEVLRDPAAFSSRNAVGPLSAERLGPILEAAADLTQELIDTASRAHPGLLLADPPEHTELRGLVNRTFTPKRVRLLEPFIEQLANELIDAFIERGSAEFLDDFAIPLPIAVIARILGIPDSDLKAMKRWSKDLVVLVGNQASPTRADVAAFLDANREFQEYVGGLIDERRDRPGDDLISALATTELGGSLIGRDVLLDLLRQFVTAGHDTTTALLAMGMYVLASDPEMGASLSSRPDTIPAFVEELLRLESPIQGLYRTTTTETSIGGVQIPADRHVLVLYAACNRDPQAHDAPATVQLDRPAPSRHLAFGQGIHFCVGAALARTEARIAFSVLVDRLVPLQPRLDGEVTFQRSFLLRGISSLPLRFAAAPRS